MLPECRKDCHTVPSSFFVAIIAAALCWMLVRPNLKEPVLRLLGFGRPAAQQKTPYSTSTPRRSLYTGGPIMFKHAAAKNATSTATKPTPIKSYVRISPVKPNPPLNAVSGNASKRPTGQQLGRTGLKRSASGLVKALSASGGFEEPFYPALPTTGTSRNTTQPTNAFLDGILIDENDFDDDFDLETEQITANDTVTYPNLSPRLAKHRSSNAIATSDIPIPWSSSPAEHFQPLNSKAVINSFRHTPFPTAPGVPTKQDEHSIKPPPRKRRNLPWENTRATQELQQANKAVTPAISRKVINQSYSWNITASAIKQQQKSIREANKKRVKTTETDDARADAIERRKKSRMHRIFLSDEQQAVLNMVVEDDKSVFFTGSAGTGKSVLLREIIAALRKKYSKDPDRVAITASTGLAACNIGGVTLHSFASVGIGDKSVEELVKKIKKNQKARHRWMRTKVLIVDEVSMVDGDLYDKLESIARALKNNGRPFGGIQLIITGDFFQLPPVAKGRQSKFAFNAKTWNTTIEKTIALHKVFRQKDPEFASMLNQMREGRLDSKSISKFKALNRELKFDDDLDATELFSTRNEVERANATRLSQLPADARIYEARDGGSITDKEWRDKLLENVMAPERITLKKGAQVMLIKNYDETLVNGSLGKIIGFMSEAEFANYHDDEEAFLSTQVPQFTRKETGKTIVDMAGTGASNVFPIVRFAIADGTTRDMLCHREQWSIELPNGEVQASRSQIPLILAWALSIHKAQGQTLERVKVNLSKAFERGQAYVALSRATSMAGLQVIGFDPTKVMAHDAVRKFYGSLSRIEDAKAKELETKVPGAYPENEVKDEVGDVPWPDIPEDFSDGYDDF